MRLEVWLVRHQRAIILDRNHDRSLRAMTGDRLGPLGSGAFDPAPFLTWAAKMGGPAIGVEAAVLFEVLTFAFEGPPPWLAPAGG